MVISDQGMIVCPHPLAAQVGLDVLKRGGNAIDAAIAVNATLGVMDPAESGIGGDLAALVWDAKSQKVFGLNASGRLPLTIDRSVFTKGRSMELKEVPRAGPLTWTVPGCVDGWDQLLKRFGSKPLSELLQPAIEYAERGHPVSESVSWMLLENSGRMRGKPLGAIYYPNQQVPEIGSIFKNVALANTYRAIAKDGRDAFYRGSIAEKIVAYSKVYGGYLELDDFRQHTSDWVEPIQVRYRGHDVWQLPPPGQGVSLLKMLSLLNQVEIKSSPWGSAQSCSALMEAQKIALSMRLKQYEDSSFAAEPIEKLLSNDTDDAQSITLNKPLKFDLKTLQKEFVFGTAAVFVGVVDRDRNCVSLMQSNQGMFGSTMNDPELGFPLQNQGVKFSLDPKHHNTLEPGKQPFLTLNPTFVTKDGKPWLCVGVTGGDTQVEGQAQVLINLIDYGANVYQAGAASRWEHLVPGGEPPQGLSVGSYALEQGLYQNVWLGLKSLGYQTLQTNKTSGRYHGIRIDSDKGILMGASDPRNDGAAIGY